jgi:hypothetical protein
MRDDEGNVTFETELLRAVVQVSRGVFQPGVHLTLTPSANQDYSIHARLQEGRRYLESDPDIIFSRYGFQTQEWTVVGTIGCHSPLGELQPPDSSTMVLGMNENTIGRTRFARFINTYMEYFARVGFSDLPQWPGLSLVPLAVYRVIPNGTPPSTPPVIENSIHKPKHRQI